MEWATAALVAIFNIILKILGYSKNEKDKSEAESAKEALNSVGESVNLEKKIDKENKKLEENHETTENSDGGISFGSMRD